MKKSILYMTIVLLGVLVIAGAAFAGGSKESGDGKFFRDYAMGGSTTVEPTVVSAIEAFKGKCSDAKLSYDSQGANVDVQGVVDEVYVLGGSSRGTSKIRNWMQAQHQRQSRSKESRSLSTAEIRSTISHSIRLQ